MAQGAAPLVFSNGAFTAHNGGIRMKNHKADTAAGIMASDAAIAASLALQFGCPLERLRRASTRNADGSASGPLAHVLDLLHQQHDQAEAVVYDDDPQSAQEQSHLADPLTETGAV